MSRTARPSSVSEIQAAIGERILWARELVEPNRSAMARAMRVDRTTLQKIEDGSRAPSVFNVLDLAEKLRVSTDYILRGSMQGVDGELAAMLVARHPELAPLPPRGGTSGTATHDGTSRAPRIPRPRQAG